MKKRLLAMLLAVVMVAAFLPTAFAADVTYGSCGADVTWSYSDGTLTITGKGPMYDYKWDNGISFVNVPWADYYKEIHTVTIGSGVTTIGNNAFFGCASLTGVTIPDGVTSIGEGAFANCSSLTYATIPDSVTIIKTLAFEHCGDLTSVTIPDGVTAIGDAAFRYCDGLTGVTIPASVTSIGYQAFYGCGSLKNVYYGGSKSQWEKIDINSNDDGNAPLLSADIYYKNVSDETETPTFTDVKESEYYAPAVAWAVKNKITSGYPDGTFGPNDDCTRAHIVTFLWNAYGKPEPTTTVNPFTDVKVNDYYYKAVLWAVENKITSGTGNGTTFDPNGTCTRKEAVTFLWRAAGQPNVTGSNSFNDVPENEYYADAVAWAVEKGITKGTNTEGTLFSPDDDCIRAQIVTFLYRNPTIPTAEN